MITELKPTNLMAVEVRADSSNHQVTKVNNYFHITYDIPAPIGQKGYGGFSLFYNDFKGKKKYPSELRLLGEVAKDKIGFDIEPYVELFSITRLTMFGYKNYALTQIGTGIINENFTCKTKEESFYSLLAANGLYFENPLGGDVCQPKYRGYCEDNCQGGCWERSEIDYDEWQSFEDRLIKGKLLILEKL